MFERYTEGARRVIFFARYEASQFGSPSHRSRPIFCLDCSARFRTAIKVCSPEPELNSYPSNGTCAHAPRLRRRFRRLNDLPLSNDSKRVLEYASDEAEVANDKRIGSRASTARAIAGATIFRRPVAARMHADPAKLRTQIALRTDFVVGPYNTFGTAHREPWAQPRTR